MFTVALTGDVGAGKSTVVKIWQAQGASVVKADEIAKAQWHKPEIIRRMTARWGEAVLTDGRPDYAKIARVAFADEDEYRFTNALIHPGTRVEIQRQVSSMRGWIVAEIPLLFEGKGHDWIDCVVCVTAPEALRISRNAGRGWDAAEIHRRERFLIDPAKKQALSDIVLTNDGDLRAWADKATELGNLFRRMAGVCEIATHCGTREEAQEIADLLLQKRLIACANIHAVESRYVWNDEIHCDSEWALSAKTTASALRRAQSLIREHHSYDLPAISVREMYGGDFATLKWIAENCE